MWRKSGIIILVSRNIKKLSLPTQSLSQSDWIRFAARTSRTKKLSDKRHVEYEKIVELNKTIITGNSDIISVYGLRSSYFPSRCFSLSLSGNLFEFEDCNNTGFNREEHTGFLPSKQGSYLIKKQTVRREVSGWVRYGGLRCCSLASKNLSRSRLKSLWKG